MKVNRTNPIEKPKPIEVNLGRPPEKYETLKRGHRGRVDSGKPKWSLDYADFTQV